MAQKFWNHLKLKNDDIVRFVPPEPDGSHLGGISLTQKNRLNNINAGRSIIIPQVQKQDIFTLHDVGTNAKGQTVLHITWTSDPDICNTDMYLYQGGYLRDSSKKHSQSPYYISKYSKTVTEGQEGDDIILFPDQQLQVSQYGTKTFMWFVNLSKFPNSKTFVFQSGNRQWQWIYNTDGALVMPLDSLIYVASKDEAAQYLSSK